MAIGDYQIAQYALYQMLAVEAPPVEIVAEQHETIDGPTAILLDHGVGDGELPLEERREDVVASGIARREQ